MICSHIDKIAEITGGYEHVALGTDFDGFIKPTMGGLETRPTWRCSSRRCRRATAPRTPNG